MSDKRSEAGFTEGRFDLRHDGGLFDIIGDVHGCADELIELMGKLGWRIALEGAGAARRVHAEAPPGRRAIFVGDLVDRGPRSPDALRVVMALAGQGLAMCVPGNHDAKFLRWLHGRTVKPTHGLDLTIAQMEREPPEFHAEVKAFLDGLPLYLWLEEGGLVVAHAGIEDGMLGRNDGPVRRFCLYGDNDGTDEEGLPIRYHWAVTYEGEAAIVYGHTPVPSADWVGNTLCIDTGCCFGGSLTALRWPQREVVSVPARAAYAERRRPLGHPPPRPETSRTR